MRRDREASYSLRQQMLVVFQLDTQQIAVIHTETSYNKAILCNEHNYAEIIPHPSLENHKVPKSGNSCKPRFALFGIYLKHFQSRRKVLRITTPLTAKHLGHAGK